VFYYPPYCLALASRMEEVAERYKLDLLHVHYAIPHSISAMLAKQMLAPKRRLPFITTLHGTDITLVGADPTYFPVTKFSIEQSDGITSISEFLRVRTVEVFGVQNEIRGDPQLRQLPRYVPAAEPAKERRRLLHVSNFRPVKRPTDCIRILAEVRRHVDAELWMGG